MSRSVPTGRPRLVDLIPSVEGPPKVTPQDIQNMVDRAAELASEPGHYATDQFNNPYIIPAHRDRLGREIWEQTEGRVTAFCHGLGTAGTVMGVSDALKPRGVFIQAHEPASSAAISGGDPGPFLIQGWTGMVMPHWDAARVDHIEPIGDDEALAMTVRLAREEGVFAGISTGANVVGAHRLAERLGPETLVVSLVADTGFNTLETAIEPVKRASRPGASVRGVTQSLPDRERLFGHGQPGSRAVPRLAREGQVEH